MKSHLNSDSVALLAQPSGPLCAHIPGFAASLGSQGYSTRSIAYKLRLVRALEQWMQQYKIGVEDFVEGRIQQFLRYRRRRYIEQDADRATLKALLKHLRESNLVPPPTSQPESGPIDHLLGRFAEYLIEQRGLRPATVKQYLSYCRRFLSKHYGNGVLSLGELSTQDICRYVLQQSRAISPRTAQCTAKALRNMLRFLQQRGDIAPNLADSVPRVAYWSLAGLPKSLSPRETELVLRCCKQDGLSGQRTLAILLLLARLGLRAGEVVRMTLEDIDWESGELTIRGKGGREDRLPLPRDVGEGLVKYLRIRPKCACRRVFVRLYAPHRGMRGSASVDYVVQQALRQAGLNLNRAGGHLFRHSLATEMLRRGASLPQIGTILRHRLPKTTAIYSKVDLIALRTLAQAWPGGVA
jgi:site-specific recombinase XerD